MTEMRPVYLRCQQCGTTFRVSPSRAERGQKFCSLPCRNESYKRPAVDGNKQCSGCGEWKPLEEFAISQQLVAGRTSRCKACNQPANREHAINWNREHPDQARATKFAVRARSLGATVLKFTADQWAEMTEAYGGRCAYCGLVSDPLTVDHVIPLSKGGQHTAENIVPACRSCNTKKSDRAPLPMSVHPERFPEIRRIA